MTTLTERLRELELNSEALKDFEYHKPLRNALAVAQELHALLVECEKSMNDAIWYTAAGGNAEKVLNAALAKLKQAGIV